MIGSRTWRGRVFIATSLDGFIARPDADLEWLTDPPRDIPHARIVSDHRALEWTTFLPDVDHIVMGRATYDTVLTFDDWPYPDQHVIVLSTMLDAASDNRVRVARALDETTRLLEQRGARSVYVDGGRTIRGFLEADLIDEITLSIAPVLIGTGIPLFDTLSRDVRLRLRAAHASESGMTHATYDVHRPGG